VTVRASPRLLLVLFGPTSSGKTAPYVDLAGRIERELGREVVVVSADSRQVYRYMDIGTSKTTAAEMHGIRHEMLDVAEPVRKLELEKYDGLARQHLADAFAAGHIPFVVGGTGIYVKALLEGWQVDRVGAARESLRRDFPRGMAADAHAMLRRLDRAAAARVHPNNYAAVINALAGIMAADQPTAPDLTTLVLGLDPGCRVLDQRVARTYDEQVARGLFDEIVHLNERYGLDRDLRGRGRDSPNQVLHTHGYREYFDVAMERGKPVARLSGAERAEVRARVVEHIRGYTRRQRSWLRKLRGARVVRSVDEAFALVNQPATASN